MPNPFWGRISRRPQSISAQLLNISEFQLSTHSSPSRVGIHALNCSFVLRVLDIFRNFRTFSYVFSTNVKRPFASVFHSSPISSYPLIFNKITFYKTNPSENVINSLINKIIGKIKNGLLCYRYASPGDDARLREGEVQVPNNNEGHSFIIFV
jgi:hypothetical protein